MQCLKRLYLLQLPITIIKTEINILSVVPCDKVLNYKTCLDSSLMSTHYITAFDKQDFHTPSAVLTNGSTVEYIEILIVMGAAHR